MKIYAAINIDFARKHYEKVLDGLNKLKFEMFTFKIDVKNLQLMSYYCLNYFDEALSLIDSYKHFLSNYKLVSEETKAPQLNFVNILNSLVRIKTGSQSGKDLPMLLKKN